MKRFCVMMASLLMFITACGSSGKVDASGSWTVTPTPQVSIPPTVTVTPPMTMTVVGPPRKTFEETAANHRGSMVFPNNTGGAPLTTISYGTTVQVECWAPNLSDMTSINVFYRVVSPKGYAPANTFANGDPLGTNGPTQIDPAVPQCAS